jgi:hypothetical protein
MCTGLPRLCSALVLALVYLNPFIGDWDGLDYTIFSLHGRPSSMALGRSAFTLFNFLLYQTAHAVFGVRPEQAYLLFKFVVVVHDAVGGYGVLDFGARPLGFDAGGDDSCFLVACSPILVIYGGQVMTDVPSVLFSATALAIHLRGLKTTAVWLILAGAASARNWSESERDGWVLSSVADRCAIRGRLWFQPEDNWNCGLLADRLLRIRDRSVRSLVWRITELSRRLVCLALLDAARGGATSDCLRQSAAFPDLLFPGSRPLILISLPFALWKEWRTRGASHSVFTAAVVGLFATAMLFLNYSTTINWRYFLTGLPGLAPLAGDYFLRIQTKRFGTEQRGFVSAIIGIALVAFFMGVLIQPKSNEYFSRLAQAKTYDAQLKLMPRDAVVIAGAQTVAVQYWRASAWESGIGLASARAGPRDNSNQR